MKFEWIKCKDRLPENPTNPLDEYEYFVSCKAPTGGIYYSSMSYADGWNCQVLFDGTVNKEHELKDIVAWAEIPKYKG